MKSRTTCTLALLVYLSVSTTSQADVRSEAMAMLAKLRQAGVAASFPEDLRNLDATVATAEMYYHLNDQQNAERYYRQATLKGSLLQERLKVATTAPASTEPVAPTAPTPTASAEQLPAPPTPAQPLPVTPPLTTHQDLPATVQPVQSLDAAPIQSAKLVGTIGNYTVVRNDTLRLVAAKLGVSRNQLIAMNGLSPKSYLKVGQSLRYNNQRIIPRSRLKDGIVINIPDRMLYYFQKGELAYATAVALGTPTKMDDIPWHTPTGRFRIVNKAKYPTWTVPPSIQEEMRREGKEVITSIPPGVENPLGKYAMKTSLPGILIHSTIKPWSIYTYASHGCIRVYPDRMEELFKLVRINTPGEIIYQPVKVATTEEGRILLEVHGDIYAKTKGIERETKILLNSMRIGDKVDWAKVKQVISRRAGVAEEITREAVEAQQQEPPPVQQPQSPS